MPAKTTKSAKAKSNVARATGKAGLLNKKVKFNWKIAAVIGVVLVAALGYLFVRLSQAGSYAWGPQDIQLAGNGTGERVTKSDGRPAVQSQTPTATSSQILIATINSSVSQADTYCVDGNATADTQITPRIFIGTSSITALTMQKVGAGPFNVCWTIAGNTTGQQRKIDFAGTAARDKPFAYFKIERKGTASGSGTKTTSNAPASPSASPATK
ncbi:MAG: hypothetical protein QG658_446 [Patescibacteria group bacterium]|nr:hypothetical protein [Patescibacteria group bacterium]